MANTTLTPHVGAVTFGSVTPRVNPVSVGSGTSIKLWQGTSSDTKPNTADLRLSRNDVFFETDTFKYYIWDGSTWHATTAAGGVAGTPPMRRS